MDTIKLTTFLNMKEINEMWQKNPGFFDRLGTTKMQAEGTTLDVSNWMVRGVGCASDTMLSPAKDSDGNEWIVSRNANKDGSHKFCRKEDIDRGYGFSIFGCYFNDEDPGDEEADEYAGTIEIGAEFADRVNAEDVSPDFKKCMAA